MKKKIAFFSTGVPDPTQGGSGIFNYLACDYLVRNDYEVSAFFRVNEDFLDKHSDLQYLRNLEEKGLKYHFVYEHKQKRLIFGWRYFLEAHQFEVCKQSIEENCLELQQVDGCLSLDAGWALALTELKVPRVCMLGDPLQHRMALGGSYSFLKPSSWKGWICKESLKNVNNRLKKELSIFNGERFAIGSFPLHQSEELQNYGIPCRHYRFFTPEPVKAKTAYRDGSLDNKIIALHVGSLYSTAGRKALNYLYKEVFPVISRLPYEFEVRFVGKCEKKHMVKSKWSNIDLKFLGHLDTLESEFLNADIFLSLLKYSVGVRTRIITALSYGIPVIADSSVAGGLPELVPERDIMYSDSPEEISVRLKTVKGNPQCMKNIGENITLSFLLWFSK